MVADSLPPAFGLLEREPNTAADAALIDALPLLSPSHRSAALDLLVKRAHGPSLSRLVGLFSEFDEATRRALAERAADLATAIRAALRSSDQRIQLNAVQMIADGGGHRIAYLLVDGLRSTHVDTKRRAADVLVALADETSSASSSPDRIRQIGDALAEAVSCWDTHEQGRILEAALWFADRTESVIRRRLEPVRSPIAAPLRQMLGACTDPRAAGFVLRSLAIAPSRPAAVRAITSARQRSFHAAIFDACWLLADGAIARGCRAIRPGPWCQRVLDMLPDLDEHRVAGAVQLLLSIGGSAQQKERLVMELIGLGSGPVLQSVTWRLCNDAGRSATRLLSIIASRPGSSAASMAVRELCRRQRGIRVATNAASAGSDARFDALWEALDATLRDGRPCDGGLLNTEYPDALSLIRPRLGSPRPIDRIRAIRLAAASGQLTELADEVSALAHDPDALVRGAAVGLLDRLPDSAAIRLVRLAVSDPDDRVQANAIESLDRLDAADRLPLTRPKLDSPNGRVRANAVKSLLRLEVPEAGDALLSMLDNDHAAQRISGLWVVDRLRLYAAGGRVSAMVNDDPSQRVRRRASEVHATLGGSSASAFEVRSKGGKPDPAAVGEPA